MTVIHADLYSADQLLTVADLARRLAVSKPTAYGLLHDGAIKSVRVGHQYRVHPRHLAEYLDRVETRHAA